MFYVRIVKSVICSKCETNETTEGQRYCRSCRAAYMRKYRGTVLERGIRRALRHGGELFKEKARARFQALGIREMNGLTAAAIIEDLEV